MGLTPLAVLNCGTVEIGRPERSGRETLPVFAATALLGLFRITVLRGSVADSTSDLRQSQGGEGRSCSTDRQM